MTDSVRNFKFSELSPISQWVLRISGLILLAIFFLVAYFYFTFIDENITQGSGYGFSIGEDKRTVFNDISKIYNKEIVRIAVFADGDIVFPKGHLWNNSTSNRKVTFSKQEFQEISQFDHWRLHFNEYFYSDYLDFQFQEGKLVSIHRFRLYLESL
jgi:hypothetical protein